MGDVLAAEPTKLAHLQAVRVVLFVFHGVVIALFALITSKGNFNSHRFVSSFIQHKASAGSGRKPYPFLHKKISPIAGKIKFSIKIPQSQPKAENFPHKSIFRVGRGQEPRPTSPGWAGLPAVGEAEGVFVFFWGGASRWTRAPARLRHTQTL